MRQRVYGLVLGYEDWHDHDALRRDPLVAALAESADLGAPGAGKRTRNRLGLRGATVADRERDQKITVDHDAVDRLFVHAFVQAHPTAPAEIVRDLDATDDPGHGAQEGRVFHGDYGHYCYLPLYIFAGEHLLCADSGFCRDALMTWCETHAVDYVFGLAKNARRIALIQDELAAAATQCATTERPARVFAERTDRTVDRWSCARRVIAKAEQLTPTTTDGEGKRNPRFVVTSLPLAAGDARTRYEDVYCARGEMEHRIKEQQLGLCADRTSAATFRANPRRLSCSSVAYVLLAALRRLGLAGTALAKAQCTTIRLTLRNIGARIRVTVRTVWLALARGCPHAALFAQVHAKRHRCPTRA